MLWYCALTIGLGCYLASSETITPIRNVETNKSMNGIASGTVISTENAELSKTPEVIPSESVLPVIPETPALLPQELVTPGISNEPVAPSMETDSLILPAPEKSNFPELEEIPSQNPEVAAVLTSTESDVIVTEGFKPDVEENKPNSICQKRNTYYNVAESCDAYVECREFIPEERLCPDGLHYNPESKWPEYPCGYPMEVSCQGRGAAQQSIPTEDCPNQYGYYSPLVMDPNNCAAYRMCVGGKSMDMLCPFGLAFNPDTSRCDWPGNVESCNSEVFLGFKCPPYPMNTRGEPLDVIINYKNDYDCHKFFSCHAGVARLLSCDLGFVFDPIAGRCADSDLVPCHTDQPTQTPTLS